MKPFSTLVSLLIISFLVCVSLDNLVQGQVERQKGSTSSPLQNQAYVPIQLAQTEQARKALPPVFRQQKTETLGTLATCNPPCDNRFPQCCGNLCIQSDYHCCNDKGDFCGRTSVCCGSACMAEGSTCCSDGFWCPDGRACCNGGKGCCPDKGQICCGTGCINEGSVCCENHACKPGSACCGTSCMPEDAECCEDGPPNHWCQDGLVCCQGSCILPEDVCCGGGYYCSKDFPVCCPNKCCKKNCGCCQSDPSGCCCFGEE